MNELLKGIARSCREHLLDEKWLLAPSLRVAHQWMESVARSGQGLLNCRPQTIRGLALEIAAPTMAEKSVTFLSKQAALMISDRILHQQRGRQHERYLLSLEPSVALSKTVLRVISALRLAGLGAEDLRDAGLEVQAKARELAGLLDAYLDALAAEVKIDYPGVLTLAMERLQKDPSTIAEDVHVLLPVDLDLTGLEKQFVQALPEKQCILLETDRPCFSPGDKPPGDTGGVALQFTHAFGAVNEFRGAIRRCMARGTPLDQVEILYTDAETYVPILYEQAERLGLAGESDGSFGITFADGIGVRYSRPGRSLSAWLEWTGSDYPQTTLTRMLREGLLNPPGEGALKAVGCGRLARCLGGISIYFGRDRYLPGITEAIEGLQEQVEQGEDPDEDGEIDPDRLAGLQARLQETEALQQAVAQLLEVCPTAEDSQIEILAKSVRFLEKNARVASELDGFVRRRLIDEISEMTELVVRDGREEALDARGYLQALAADLRVGGSGPRPGCMHAAHVLSGGHSGRGCTFVLGLDDSRFPGAGLQNPILLDSERRELSGELITAASEVQLGLEKFTLLLARLRGEVTLSFTCRDLVEDRELFPSQVVLNAYRRLAATPDADQSDLLAALGPPESFSAADEAGCVDFSEWCVHVLTGPRVVTDPLALVDQEFPHLGRGREASRARASDQATPWDGFVPEAGQRHDPRTNDGPVFSPSRTETLGTCPLRYLFKYALRISPPEDLAVDTERWLSHLDFGSLIHEVLCRFMRHLRGEDLTPSVAEHSELLGEMVRQAADTYRKRVPPPNEQAYQRQHAELLQTAKTFLAVEERFCRDYQPEYMEAAIGMVPDGEGTAIDTPEPVVLPLPSGAAIRVRGRIDRVDRIGPASENLFAVWDYKSGSTWKFEQSPPFWQGRVLQHAVYLQMAQQRLRKLHPGSRVVEVGYFFPARGGERKKYTAESLRGSAEIIEALCCTVARGAFLATDSPDDCTYCDYAGICGDASGVAAASKRKLGCSSNQVLQPLASLRGYHDHS